MSDSQHEILQGTLDNYATHKHADVQTWLAKDLRSHLAFTPTCSS